MGVHQPRKARKQPPTPESTTCKPTVHVCQKTRQATNRPSLLPISSNSIPQSHPLFCSRTPVAVFPISISCGVYRSSAFKLHPTTCFCILHPNSINTLQRKQLPANFSYKHRCNNTCELNPRTHQNDHLPCQGWIHSRDTGMVQYMKIRKKYNSPC